MTKNFEYKMTFDSRLIKSETARKLVIREIINAIEAYVVGD